MEKISYRDILKLKEYRKLIISNIVNRFGDSVDAIAFTWLVYAVTGSASWSAIMYALNQLPTVLLQPFAGTLVERMNKKRTIVVTDFIRGIIIVGVALIYIRTGAVSPWILAAMTLLISSVEAFCLPASTALVPMILEKKYLSHGLSLSSAISSTMQLIGMASAGVIIGFGGAGAAMAVDAATFFIAGMLIALIKTSEDNVTEETTEKEKLDFASYFVELKEGFKYVAVRRVILNFCILAMVVNAFFVPLNAFQTPLIVEIFKQGSELLSAFGIAFVIGMAAGSVVTPVLMRRFKVRPLIVFFGVVTGLIYALYNLGLLTQGNTIAAYVVCCSCTFFIGVSSSILSQIFTIQFINSVEQQYLARAASILNASSSAATPVASALVGVLAGFMHVTTLFYISSVTIVLVFVYIGIAKVRLSNDDENAESMNTAA